MSNFKYGRTLTKLFNFESSNEIPPATPNGGFTVGEPCVGEHCSIPITPTAQNYKKYINENGVNNIGVDSYNNNSFSKVSSLVSDNLTFINYKK